MGAGILLLVCPPVIQAQHVADALSFVASHESPTFADDHSLPPLAHWRRLSFDVMEALVDWGYGLHLYATPGTVRSLDDPASEASRIVELVASDPERYPLTVRIAPAAEIQSGRISLDAFPPEAFYRDRCRRLVGGEYHFSPLASDDAISVIAAHVAEQVRAIRARAPISVVVNGGEYGFEKPQRVPRTTALGDPRVRTAWQRDGRPWVEFMSDHKARHERVVAEAVREAAPEALYIHYSEVGGGHPRRFMVDDWERYDFLFRPGVSDLASSRHYHRHGNSDFTGPHDILSQLLNSRAQEIAGGGDHAYFWLSAGWVSRGEVADADLYAGFLKSAYVSGSIGAVAGYFGARPYDDPVDVSMPQFLTLGRIHALFSHVDELLLNSDLLPGPEPHRWSRDLPAYEFPTGDPDKRVLVRRHRERPQWLVSAWAADGGAAEVEVMVPELGSLQLEATPAASVYVIELDPDARPIVDVLGQ